MPRGKRAEQPVAEAPAQPNLESETDEQLIKKHIELDDWIKAENKRFASFLEPHKQMLEVIANEFLRRLNERKAENSKTEYGTAYISTLLNISVSPEGSEPYRRLDSPVDHTGDYINPPALGREALLDFALDHWDEIGNELLMISAQKDAVKRWMDEHNGAPPPGIKASRFRRVNIRRG